tara:strand:+ start:362 stop:571 length:210 start_codon:yes stop_codon:yes gene_type:complete
MKSILSSKKKPYMVLDALITKFKKSNILETGIQIDSSILKFIAIYKKKNRKLYSVDIADCSKLFNNKIR